MKPIIHGKFWTLGRLRTLRNLWREGNTGGEIAEQLGCSRGKVLGKLHRLGLLGLSDEERTLRLQRGAARIPPEVRTRRAAAGAAALRSFWSDERYRARMLRIARRNGRDPEQKAKREAGRQAMHADPVRHAAWIAALRIGHARLWETSRNAESR